MPSCSSETPIINSEDARLTLGCRHAWKKTTYFINKQLGPAQAELQPILARNKSTHPIHPAAYLKQSKGRWYTTHSQINAAVRKFSTAKPTSAKYDRASFPKSRVASAISATGRQPFASALRPNLTGGTLNRTAGGYALGAGKSGVRHFSHSPAAPAQVVHNVSQAVRAFLIGGQKAQFDGTDARGDKLYRAVTALQEEVGRKMTSLPKATPGSYIDFIINPTITALAPVRAVAGFDSVATKDTLNSEGLLDCLSVDFSRSLKDLAVVLNDIKALSSLGDLPITYRSSGTVLRIHFPGCDADSVERLCLELGVRRGIVRQDEDFDAFVGTEIALLFPFASSSPEVSEDGESLYEQALPTAPQERIHWRLLPSPSASSLCTLSNAGFEDLEDLRPVDENPWLSSSPSGLSGYESLHTSDVESAGKSSPREPLEYQGFEGIYKFMEACESSRA